MKKLLLLGGSRYLFPVIKVARELGIYTITCDYLPDNDAHKVSDEYHNVSVVEKDKVLELARELKVDGVMSFACDPGVVSAAYTAEKLGLPFQCSYKAAEILQNKGLFRTFLRDNGFDCPFFRYYSSKEDALSECGAYSWPMIVKPVDSAGSKGVSKVNDAVELSAAIDRALEYSHCDSFIVEKFLTFMGHHSSADVFAVDGKLCFTTFSDSIFDSDADNTFVPARDNWPSTMKPEHQQRLNDELQRAFDILGVTTGIFNIDSCVGSDGTPYLMEISPRGGGDSLAEIQDLMYGTKLIEAEVRKAVGLPLNEVRQTECSGFWYWQGIYVDQEQSGRLKKIYIDDDIKDKYVVLCEIDAKEGDMVMPFSGANMSMGDVLMHFDTREELDAVMSSFRKWMHIELEQS